MSTNSGNDSPANDNAAALRRREPLENGASQAPADIAADHQRIVEAIQQSPGFACVMDDVVWAAAQEALEDDEDLDDVDPGLAERSRFLSAKFMLIGCRPRVSRRMIRSCRGVVETFWRERPLVGPDGDGKIVQKESGARPWENALYATFELGAYGGAVVVKDAEDPVDRSAVAFRVVTTILRHLARAGVRLPPNFSDAIAAACGAGCLDDIDDHERDRFARAAALIERLLYEEALADGRKRLRMSIGFKDLSRSKLSAWGAAARFADCFDVEMPRRMHDVVIR